LSDGRRQTTLILRSPHALHLTLALIKPAVVHPLILEAVHQQIQSNKFLIVQMREFLWRKEDCQKFYQEFGGVHGQWANLSLNPPPQGCHPDLEDPEGWDPPECFEHATWPQIQFVGVLASPTPVTQAMAQTVVSAS
ncbi:hypothetical protein E2I00_014771, partial [Balaenoptera physalus]